MRIEFFKKSAGLISAVVYGSPRSRIEFGVAIHLLVRQQHWQLGLEEEWYDGPFYSFGLGPLFLICWMG